MHLPSGKRPKYCFRDSKSPFWQYDFSIAGERERGTTRESTSAKAAQFVAARRTLMLQRQAAARMGITTATAKPITLFEACALFESKWPHLDSTTRYQIENLCALLCANGENRRLRDIGTPDFAEYRRQRQSRLGKHGRALSGATINREVQLARRIWKHAAALDYDVGKMPNWKAVILRRAEHNGTRYLSVAEEQRLLEALERVNPDLKLLAEFALLSGQRKSAIVGLRWNDVDESRREAKFILKTHGESKREHTIPLTTRMMDIIRSLPRVCEFVFTYECRRPSPRRKDRPARMKGARYPFTSQGWTRQWHAALELAGVKDFRWHDLRHTSATRLLQAVNNLRMVQELLGHQSIQQTARYAHLSRADLRDGMQRTQSAQQSLDTERRIAA